MMFEDITDSDKDRYKLAKFVTVRSDFEKLPSTEKRMCKSFCAEKKCFGTFML